MLPLPSEQRLTNKEPLLQNLVGFSANPAEEHPTAELSNIYVQNCISLLSGPFTITLM